MENQNMGTMFFLFSFKGHEESEFRFYIVMCKKILEFKNSGQGKHHLTTIS